MSDRTSTVSAPRRVLLISPVPERDPDNGDVTYTQQLLARPPDGVRYVTYDEALREGSIRERYRRAQGEHPLATLRSQRETRRFARESLINKARSRNLLFRERFRHFDVRPGAFDLVHAHVFSVGLEPRGLPLVVSNSIPVDAVYRDGLERPRAEVAFKRAADRWLADVTGVTHSAYGHRGADLVVCFSDHLRDWFLLTEPDPARFAVVPPGIHPGPEPTRRQDACEPFTIGFIGHWESKGGDEVLAAHRLLRARGIDVRLTVVGSTPRLETEDAARLGVTWLPRQPRDRLLKEIVPTFSAFIYPSRFDGLPLTVLEVMAAGVPVVVSDYGALPEVVDYGRAGHVVPAPVTPEALVDCIEPLLDPSVSERLGRAGRERVVQRYDIKVTSPALGAAYHTATQRRGAT